MALVRCDFPSEVLQLDTAMTVLLPDEPVPATGYPTLYLLHGLSDDHTAWVRRTSIERYIEPMRLAVVMPAVHRSFYTDEVHGGRYWTFLSEELPERAGAYFRLSQRREDTFVAGLSMGGYGALKWALRQPERFAAAASLSGALDVAARQSDPRALDTEWIGRVFGTHSVAGTDDDLFALIDGAAPPPLYVGCGTDDFLYPDNVRFVEACRGKGVDVTVDFGPGDHVWEYWDRGIQQVLGWLPLPGTPVPERPPAP
jgi:S-formylglutathione hydrolase FrmB